METQKVTRSKGWLDPEKLTCNTVGPRSLAAPEPQDILFESC